MENVVWYYIVTTLVASFAIGGIFVYAFPKDSKTWTSVFPFIYTMLPAGFAILVSIYFNLPVSAKEFGLKFSGNAWYYLIAFLFPILMAAVVAGVQFLLKNCTLKPDIKWKEVIAAFVVELLVLPILIAGEEVGWRGFLQNKVVNEYGFWQATIIIGVVWGLWHAPVALRGYNLSSLPYFETFVFYPLSCTGLSAILIFLTYKTNSMIPALIFHTTNNSIAVVSQAAFDGKSTAKSVITVISFFVIIVLVVGLMVDNDLKLVY